MASRTYRSQTPSSRHGRHAACRGGLRDAHAASSEIERTTAAVLLLTVEGAAQRLSIGRTTMYSLVSAGVIKSVTIGRLRRIPSECLDEYVSSLRTSGQPESAAALVVRGFSRGGNWRRQSTQAVCAMPSMTRSSRHYRIFGEMADKLRFIRGDILDADAIFVAAYSDNSIDQKERIAVGQQPQDFVNVGGAKSLFVHSGSPLRLSLLASRRSAATPFIKSRIGRAGEPTQRSPGGTSCITPLCAPSCAPVPIVT